VRCLFCGEDNPDEAIVCYNCGKRMIQKQAIKKREIEAIEEPEAESNVEYEIEYPSELEPTSKLPAVGGALLIVAALIGFATNILLGQIASLFGIGISGIIFFISIGNFLGLVAGWAALYKKVFTLVIIFGIFGIIAGLFSPFLLGFLLSLIGIGFIAAGHSEFE